MKFMDNGFDNHAELQHNGHKFDLWAEKADGAGLVEIAPNLAVWSDYVIHAKELSLGVEAQIKMSYYRTSKRLGLAECRYVACDPWRETDGLKIRDILRFPVDKIMGAFEPALYVVENGTAVGPLSEWERLLEKVPFSEMKRPTAQALELASRIYHVAELLRKSPTKSVAERFGLPASTASHWVRLMRERVAFDSGKCAPMKKISLTASDPVSADERFLQLLDA